MKKRYYWDSVSNEIGKALYTQFMKNMAICEIGFSGGHFLEWLYDKGYTKLYGIEIRKDQFLKTQKSFQEKNLKINLILGDVLDFNQKYDGVYSTGLIQCLDVQERERFLNHVSQMAKIAVFTVPEIKVDRNIGSDQLVAVDGCKEFATGNIPYELSQFYDEVRVGRINKSKTHIEDTFLYFICKKGE